MSKYKISYLFFAAFIFILLACEKNNDTGNGSILVTVKSHGSVVADAAVYLKRGTLSNPHISLDQYDKVLPTDGSGQMYFDHLPSADYFIYVKGYSPQKSGMVQGEASVVIGPGFDQKYTEITVDVE